MESSHKCFYFIHCSVDFYFTVDKGCFTCPSDWLSQVGTHVFCMSASATPQLEGTSSAITYLQPPIWNHTFLSAVRNFLKKFDSPQLHICNCNFIRQSANFERSVALQLHIRTSSIDCGSAVTKKVAKVHFNLDQQ